MNDEPRRPGDRPGDGHGDGDGPGDGDGHGEDDFDRIVAGLELSLPDDLEPGVPERDEPARDEPARDEPAPDGPGHDRFGPVEPEEEDLDRFVPPEPEPLPPLDPVSRAAWTVLLGAPSVLLVAVVLAWDLPRAVTGVLVLGFVGALVLLLVKRGNTNRGDDPDHGAVL